MLVYTDDGEKLVTTVSLMVAYINDRNQPRLISECDILHYTKTDIGFLYRVPFDFLGLPFYIEYPIEHSVSNHIFKNCYEWV